MKLAPGNYRFASTVNGSAMECPVTETTLESPWGPLAWDPGADCYRRLPPTDPPFALRVLDGEHFVAEYAGGWGGTYSRL